MRIGRLTDAETSGRQSIIRAVEPIATLLTRALQPTLRAASIFVAWAPFSILHPRGRQWPHTLVEQEFRRAAISHRERDPRSRPVTDREQIGTDWHQVGALAARFEHEMTAVLNYARR